MGIPDHFRGCPDVALVTLSPMRSPSVALRRGSEAISLLKKQGAQDQEEMGLRVPEFRREQGPPGLILFCFSYSCFSGNLFVAHMSVPFVAVMFIFLEVSRFKKQQ